MREVCTNKTRFNTVFYHKNCPDGFASAWVYWNLSGMSDKVKYIGITPGLNEMPSSINNKNILLVDVAFSPEIMKRIVKKANCVQLIDHHITNIELIGHQDYTYLDVNHAGCVLTWKYFHPDKHVPLFLHLMENHDLGKFDESTEAFNIKLQLDIPGFKSKNFRYLNKFLNNKVVKKYIAKGKQLYEYQRYIIKRNVRATIHKFRGYKVCVSNTTTVPLKGLIATEINKEYDCDFTMAWALEDEVYSVSLRTTKENINLAAIAEEFGGGGHPKAAAFFYKGDNLFDIFD